MLICTTNFLCFYPLLWGGTFDDEDSSAVPCAEFFERPPFRCWFPTRLMAGLFPCVLIQSPEFFFFSIAEDPLWLLELMVPSVGVLTDFVPKATFPPSVTSVR